jgi:hypothetical protein
MGIGYQRGKKGSVLERRRILLLSSLVWRVMRGFWEGERLRGIGDRFGIPVRRLVNTMAVEARMRWGNLQHRRNA